MDQQGSKMKMPTDPSRTYTSPRGRAFRVSGLGRHGRGWKVIIKFLDGEEEFAELYFDSNENFKGIKT